MLPQSTPQDPIIKFDGEYRYLSNFHYAPFQWNGIDWSRVECAYQAAKSLRRSEWYKISLMGPGDAKRYGRTIACRPDWDNIKDDVMLELVLLKFISNPQLAARLVSTGDRWIEEGNNHRDVYWGVCPVGSGFGHNKLGKILMEVREHLREHQ